MFCRNCGVVLADGQAFCSTCGYKQNAPVNAYTPPVPQTDPNDKNNTGLNVLGFVIPIFALIYYLCTRKDRPIEAKGVGKWGLIGFISWFVFYIILMILVFVFTFGITMFAINEGVEGTTYTMATILLNNFI